MKSKRLNLSELKVKSFVTDQSAFDMDTLKGGSSVVTEASVRVVMNGCWVSQPTGPEQN